MNQLVNVDAVYHASLLDALGCCVRAGEAVHAKLHKDACGTMVCVQYLLNGHFFFDHMRILQYKK